MAIIVGVLLRHHSYFYLVSLIRLDMQSTAAVRLILSDK